jgi:predicted dienelactone hydrolase
MLTRLTFWRNVSGDNIERLAMKLIAVFAAACVVMTATRVLAADAGFQEAQVPNPGDQPITIGIWYPTAEPAREQRLGVLTQVVAPGAAVAGDSLPLVVMSHGTGGWYASHYDTALALARAGFVVAALTHPGDNYMDKSRAGQIRRRPPQLQHVLDYMLTEWPNHARIDPQRIGAFGFSAGGFTVLAAIGGMPDFAKIAPHCQAHPDYFECELRKRAGTGLQPADPDGPAPASFKDARIKAAVIAAPALGYTFGQDGLDPVTVPVQLWSAEFDHILPAPDYADSVRAKLPRPPEFHLVAKADHFDFLAPCSAELAKIAPDICQALAGFDRAEFHQRFNAEVVRFFRETLK